MKKHIQIIILTLFLGVVCQNTIYAQEVEATKTLNQPETTSRTVEATKSITLLPGFYAIGSSPFTARIIPENVFDVVLGTAYNLNEARNWVSSTSYDLSGNLTSSGVSYFNTLGKATQSHSLDIKTGKIWASEVRYDAFGRPVFSSLSAPVGKNYGYKNSFISTLTGATFNQANLEAIQNNAALPIVGNQENTLGWYYSEANTSEKYQDITAHPYSKTIYSKLNPGIALKALGGNKIKKTASSQEEWLQSYSFDMPMAQEMFYEFGANYFPQREEVPSPKLSTKVVRDNDPSGYTLYDLTRCSDGLVVNQIRMSEDEILVYGKVYKIGLGQVQGYFKVTGTKYVFEGGDGDNILHRTESLSNPIDDGPTKLSGFGFLMDDYGYTDCPYGRPSYIKGKKTVVRDVHGVESVVFTDSEGNVMAAARSGNEDGKGVQKTVISPINKQGYVDIHIPNGCGGTVTFLGGGNFKVYDLITEGVISNSVSGSMSLSAGFYRVETLDKSYNPEHPYAKLTGTTPSLLDDTTTKGVQYKVNYYDYSLNYYDQSNRLVKSTQPLSKSLASTFTYNTLGQLLETTSPDEGKAEFKYRKDGQIRFSQNTKQKAVGEFSYTNYDNYGRPIESGVATGDFTTLNVEASSFTGTKKEQHFTVYDVADTSLSTVLSNAGIATEMYKQQFVSGNVVKTYTTNPSTTTTWYSYDAYGRVTWMIQDIEGLGVKTIDYEYDFAKGQVTKVIYQKYKSNELFAHKYTYNVAGELFKVETSTNNSTFTEQAKYKYYETGALKRVEIAQNVQGIDYIYNLNGQLKAINHPSRDTNLDPGKDGANGMAQDLFGFALDYYNGDYLRINTPTPVTVNTGFEVRNQYNGNIKATRWSNSNIANGAQASQLFSYNKNNWLTEANFGSATNTGGITPNTYGNYKVFGLEYDANGNIKKLNRNKDGNASNGMDALTYTYKTSKPNQLDYVADAVGNAGVQDIDTQSAGNYEYNTIGQLIENKKEKVKYKYNASGLVTKVLHDNILRVQFFYNDKGYRIKKVSYLTSGVIEKTTHYVRDAAGSAMAIYENQEQKELPIYGASRLGVVNKADESSIYQLTDHLGNVRATVGKTASGQVLAASSATDYYPFGMPMPNRQIINGEPYRYAYQGQEKDPETGKEAFQLRLWDARIGRWLTTDPYGEFSSPYIGMGNNPIRLTDPDGGHTDDIYQEQEDGSFKWVAASENVEFLDKTGNKIEVNAYDQKSVDAYYGRLADIYTSGEVSLADYKHVDFMVNMYQFAGALQEAVDRASLVYGGYSILKNPKSILNLFKTGKETLKNNPVVVRAIGAKARDIISKTSPRFWKSYDKLPSDIQKLASKQYQLFKQNPGHPSLNFEHLGGFKDVVSVRINKSYRAYGKYVDGVVEWSHIDKHDYNLLRNIFK